MPRTPIHTRAHLVLEVRRATGLNQKHFGHRVHLSERSVQRWETGAATPGVHQAALESMRELGLSTEDVLAGLTVPTASTKTRSETPEG